MTLLSIVNINDNNAMLLKMQNISEMGDDDYEGKRQMLLSFLCNADYSIVIHD